MKDLVNFLNNYFEQIMAVNIYFVISVIVIFIFVRIRDIRLAHIQKALKHIVYYGLIIGETVLVVLSLYVFTVNFGKKEALVPDVSSSVLYTTDWVKEDLTIYFINKETLVAIEANGLDRRDVFTAPDPIREYHFSPDGRYILIVTEKDLFQYNREDKTSIRIVSLQADTAADFTGVISGIQWGPLSRKYCYRVARWTKYSSQETWYIYDIASEKKSSIKSASRRINALNWDKAGENLYYSWFDALDTTVRGNPYEVKVYKIPLAALKPELVLKFPFHEQSLSAEGWHLHGIDLFDGARHLSFGRTGNKYFSWKSLQGSRLGIDNDDHLYYIRNRWWRKRLYKIPRVPVKSDISRYQYKGGQLAVQHLRWFPSGRYVIMEHYFFGILILEPSSGKIGILDNERGNTFGWYKQRGYR